ncbi:hypothetical protein SAMN04487970_107110 [Paenibacillus tianmuensis]|uniref:Membrane protein YfhO n=1 Tax=Paenibacillus tianmuensis TaxID=624147 RepID=A0A1G4TVG0_9BACL|nr:hypothetical protein [Paenibacillus tianmuensis]SCW85402.1 hypothetical protein SAMN04487970_107110 [Paenibacillus tianmuensis]
MIKWINKTQLLNLSIIIIIFFFLQLISPKFFLMGDNKVQFYPIIVYASENLLHGTIPQINLSQYMGLPIIEKSYYGLTYPPVFLSYFLSKYVLLDPTWTIDIFVLIHLVLAAYVFSLLLSKFKVSHYLNIIGTVSYIFTSANFFMSEWYYVYPTILFLPAIFLLVFQLIEKLNFQYLFLLALVIIAYFYVGNIQLFIYCMFYFFPLYIILAYLMIRKKMYFQLAFVVMITFICLIPGLSMFYETGLAARPEKFDFSEYIGVNSDRPWEHIKHMFLPNFLMDSPNNIFYRFAFRDTMAYIGLVPAIGIILGFIYLICKRYTVNKQFLILTYLLVFGVISLLFVFGDKTIIYTWMYKIPIWNQLRSSYKHIVFSNFFLIFFGIVSMHLIISQRYFLQKILLISTILLIAINVISFNNIIGKGTHDLNQIKVQNPLNGTLDGRVVCFCKGIISSHDKNIEYSKYFAFNYASLSKVLTVGGYDVLIEKNLFNDVFKKNWYDGFYEPNDFEFYKKYGIKYIIFPSILPKSEVATLLKINAATDIKTIYTDNLINMFEVINFTPMVYDKDFNQINSSIQLEKNTIQISLGNLNYSTIGVNFLYNKNYIARDDRGNDLKINKDDYNRIVINIKDGTNTITVTYRDYKAIIAFLLSLIIFFSLIIVLFLIYRRRCSYAGY